MYLFWLHVGMKIGLMIQFLTLIQIIGESDWWKKKEKSFAMIVFLSSFF